jgi:stress response protein YsnF
MTKVSASNDVIPLTEERVTVDKIETETGRVRIRVVPRVEKSRVEGTLEAANADIERVPIDKIVDETPQPRWEGDTYVVPIVEEVLVYQKQLRLVEEVRVRRRVSQRDFAETVTLRRTEAVVERMPIEDAHIPREANPEK